ncbi:DSBA-like thioredoxin domain-containing protein, partial [Truncatella angustata]
MTHFDITIISDPVCPFCYLGKKRLDKGIELYRKVYPGGKDDTFNISWSAFYLDPTAPQVGIPLMERMEQRFGREKLPMIREALRKQGLQDGINFSTESKIGNTRNAHRLIQLAKTKGNEIENRVAMELFKAYFEDGGDITSFQTLTDAAVKAGMDRDRTKDWLDSGKGGEAVDKEVEEANAKGLSGVPQFTIQGKWQVDGAQDPRDFFDAIVAARE